MEVIIAIIVVFGLVFWNTASERRTMDRLSFREEHRRKPFFTRENFPIFTREGAKDVGFHLAVNVCAIILGVLIAVFVTLVFY